jgi:Na+-driven multidrug efflux pump
MHLPKHRKRATDVTSGSAAPNAWRTVAKSASARVLILPMSAILGILNTRLIVQHFGADAFAQYGLLVAIGTLVPFADLGMSAAVMNAVAASNDAHRDEHVRRVLTTAIRVLVASAATLLTLVVIVSVAGPRS